MRHLRVSATFALCAVACGGDPEVTHKEDATWSQVVTSQDATLLSVHGTSAEDVWMVGADDGTGPLVLHWDGSSWERRQSGLRGDLWWTHALPGGTVLFGGSDASFVKYQASAFQRLHSPGRGKHTVYGIWAASDNDVYAVGSAAGRNGFIWHFDGTSFQDLALPVDVPLDEFRDAPGLFKVWGTSATDVWAVGASGLVLHGNAAQGFQRVPSGTDALLFTVHATRDRVLIVGGGSEGVVLEGRGGEITNHTPASAPLLQGACVAENGSAWAVGLGGSIYERDGSGAFTAVDSGIDFTPTQTLHSTWVDPKGGVWSVGGNALTPELDAGIAIHRGTKGSEFVVEPQQPKPTQCPDAAIDPAPNASIARRWNEQILGAIRRDTPRPTVHARNLFHLSAAMWDAWAAYDPTVDGFLTRERHQAVDGGLARTEAISYAAYRVLSHRYKAAVGGGISQACFDAFMGRLGYDIADANALGDSPRALGNRIAYSLIARFAADGANEAGDYAPKEPYASEIPNLVVDIPGTRTLDPLHWQKLVLAKAVTQNGIPANSGAQGYVGPHWGAVEPFSLVRSAADAAYLDIGTPPLVLDDKLVEAVVDVLRRGSQLDPADGEIVDISPAAIGNNPLGTNDGTGYAKNPVTNAAYVPNPAKRGDFARVLAEFWADGPNSETPPGHWNALANQVADNALTTRKLFGQGEPLEPLGWDVRTYLALNGALHDAAIAAWELKRKYVSSRPITLVRYMGSLGQRTNQQGPSYNPQGLPLIDGLIEVITAESSAPGQRHAHMSRYVGEIAVRAWRGEPGDRETEIGGCDFVRAVEWIPYQRRTFVTPAFPGYVSGHSTFSRAAAVVLAGMTGSEYFPGGLASVTFQPGYLVFEAGPSAPVTLQWATYFDAADQAGQSRLWGGIHIRHDDFDGRRIGARVGTSALDRARAFFSGIEDPR